MSQLIEVPVENLTPDSFAAFGEVIDELPDSARAEGGFKAARQVAFSIDGEVDLRVIRYDFKPMEFHLMERHLHVTETRVPLTPEPVVLVVAQSTPPGDRTALPSLESFRAFLLNGRQGVLFGTAAWHALDCFPVCSRHADFAFLSELATEKELRANAGSHRVPSYSRRRSAEGARRAFHRCRSFRVAVGATNAATRALEIVFRFGVQIKILYT